MLLLVAMIGAAMLTREPSDEDEEGEGRCMEIGLVHYLALSARSSCSLGIFTVRSRRHVIVMLMGTELILNAAALNFVAFSRYVGGGLNGQLVDHLHHRARRG